MGRPQTYYLYYCRITPSPSKAMCAPPTQAPNNAPWWCHDSNNDSSDDDDIDMRPALLESSSDDEDHEDVFENVHVKFTIVENIWVVIGLSM